jgi:hypothetical protein
VLEILRAPLDVQYDIEDAVALASKLAIFHRVGKEKMHTEIAKSSTLGGRGCHPLCEP